MVKVNSLFNSISGEISPYHQGCLTTFVRLSGCPMNCKYCFGFIPGRRKPELMLAYKPKKQLDKICKGDILLTFNDDKELVETTVTEVMTREVDRWLRLTINGKQYFVTEEHPFFTTNGLVEAKNLKIGDMIYHSSYKDKLSFKMRGDKNPSNTEEKKIERYKSKKWITKEKNKELRAKGLNPQSENMKGEKNPNWNGGSKSPNYDNLKLLVLKGEITKCSNNCFSDSKRLDVHHIDENRSNDELSNLKVLCHSCHDSEHKKGYNFWKGKRTDGKKLIARNGFEVKEIKLFDRRDYPPSLRPKPLKVYNISCEPYNSYLIDYMWVHNCDTNHKRYELLSLGDLVNRTKNLHAHTNRLCITGGEPLLQTLAVMELIDCFSNSWIETSGVVLFEPYVGKTSLVVDYKLDIRMKRGYHCETNVEDYLCLSKRDYIKFVIGSHKEFMEFKEVYKYLKQNGCKATISVSPIHTIVKSSDLVKWCYDENINEVVLNVQLHKIIGLP